MNPSGNKIAQSIRKCNDGHERGVAVLVKNDINFKYHRLNTNVQAAAAIRIWLSKWYNVCSVYC